MSALDRTLLDVVFHEALRLRGEARYDYVRSSTHTEEAFQAVLALVQAAERSEDFLTTSIGLGDIPPTLSSGSALGEWRIGDRVGCGGMGEVYRVERTKDGFTQIGALKIPRSDKPAHLALFERERGIVNDLEHPGIARLIDGGRAEDGRPWFVMEYVEGLALTTYADGRALSERDRLALFGEVAKAVAHAHGRLVLHRDLKPENALVGEDGHVKLIDFGVAGAEGVSGCSPLTQAYAAPERSTDDPATTRIDIYALGILLRELLTGDRSPESGKGLPADLEAIIDKATRTLPMDRYAVVEDMIGDIDAYLDGRPVEARGAGRLYRLGRWVGRNRGLAAASLALMLSVGAGFAATYIQLQETRAAVAAMETANEDTEFEARILQGFRLALMTLWGNAADGDSDLTDAEISQSVSAMVDPVIARYDGTDLTDGYLLFATGQMYMNRLDWGRAAEVLAPLVETSTEEPLGLRLSIEARSDYARSLSQIGRTEDAIPVLEALMRDRETHGELYTTSHIQDAGILAYNSDDPKAQEAYVEAIQTTIARLEAENGDEDSIGYLHNQLGIYHYGRGELDTAIPHFEAAFRLDEGQAPQTPADLTPARNLAVFYNYHYRDGERVLDYLTPYRDLARDTFGHDVSHVELQNMVAFAAALLGNWEDVLLYTQEIWPTVDQDRRLADSGFLDTAALRSAALNALGRDDEAFDSATDLLAEIESRDSDAGMVAEACVARMALADSAAPACETEISAFEGADASILAIKRLKLLADLHWQARR